MHERTRAYEQPEPDEPDEESDEEPAAKPRNAFDLLAADDEEEDANEEAGDAEGAEREVWGCCACPWVLFCTETEDVHASFPQEDTKQADSSQTASKKKRKKKACGAVPPRLASAEYFAILRTALPPSRPVSIRPDCQPHACCRRRAAKSKQ